MRTNKERINYLHEKIKHLNIEIKERGLEESYLELVENSITNKQPIKIVDDNEWEFMLEKEKEINLLCYYHTFRVELKLLTDELKQQNTGKKIIDWLDKPWIKISLSSIALIEFTIKIYEIASNLGLFFDDEKE